MTSSLSEPVSATDIIFSPQWEYRNSETGVYYKSGIIRGKLLYSKLHGDLTEKDAYGAAECLKAVYRDGGFRDREFIRIADYADVGYVSIRTRKIYAHALKLLNEQYNCNPLMTYICGASFFIKASLQLFAAFVKQRFIFTKTIDDAFTMVSSSFSSDESNQTFLIGQQDIDEISAIAGSLFFSKDEGPAETTVSSSNPLKSLADILLVAKEDVTELQKTDREFKENLQRLADEAHEARLQTEEVNRKLKLSEERLDLAMSVANDGYFDWNMDTDVLYFDDRYYRMAGYEPHDFPPTLVEWENRVHKDDRPEVRQRLDDYLCNNISSYDIEFRFRRKDCSWMWVRARAKVVSRNERGEPLRFVGTHSDITERKHLEEKLRHSEKMEAIGHLAGGIAHDFNNVLGAIIGYADMSLDDVDDGSILAQNIGRILQSSQRAKNLVQQILSFSKQSAKEKTPQYVKPLIKEIVHLLRASLPSTIQIKTEFSHENGAVLIDAAKLHEAIVNICTNAAYAMDHKGLIEITSGSKKFGKETIGVLGTVEIGHYTFISINDTGCGIRKDQMSHIFEPFYTTREVGKGTGMGLAIVFGILKSLDGNIIVESTPGSGTRFELVFPQIAEEPEAHTRPVHGQSEIGGDESILLVDDERVLSDMLETMLKRLGYTVSVFMSSTAALHAFEQSPHSFDLVITDQTMPEMTGLELSEKLLHIRPDIPIILCTGYSSLVHPENLENKGIRLLLQKPIRKKQIAVSIRSVLDAEAGS